ncbi:hypothetical protein NONO_c51420 [Nocardia nova SH22a]|uniref:Uncharacterized protein n=1 Tax=Nocardia nova SH22a TaxID=1415166 RepID=W5TRT2_9NOCA|nr:hypothetical protein [Nocardia nova]AHH19926.1 hypothetical protein NONO_c51420 [Nocardia nova SH22a]
MNVTSGSATTAILRIRRILDRSAHRIVAQIDTGGGWCAYT